VRCRTRVAPLKTSLQELTARGGALLHSGDPHGALSLFEQALALQTASTDARAVVDILNALGVANRALCRWANNPTTVEK
jgi:hypothetical protein